MVLRFVALKEVDEEDWGMRFTEKSRALQLKLSNLNRVLDTQGQYPVWFCRVELWKKKLAWWFPQELPKSRGKEIEIYKAALYDNNTDHHHIW